MPTIPFPRRHLPSLQDLGSRVLESRPVGGDNDLFARDLLAGFFHVCMRAGLDGVLVELAQAFGPFDIADEVGLSDAPRLRADLAARLGNKAEFDPRGPRNAKPGQLADCLIATLSLEPADPPSRAISLTGELRRDVVAALAGVLDVELAVPQIRDAIIATGRARCEPRYHKAFDKISAGLDERGMRTPPAPKIPLDAVQAVQQALFDARVAVIDRAARAAVDRAKEVLARASAEAAERIDAPITHRLTPREVAIQRVCEPRVTKTPEAVRSSLLDSLSELAELAWQLREQTARPYAVTHTYAVGEVLEHPKFGRGTVQSVSAQRIEVEFPDGARGLVHARPPT